MTRRLSKSEARTADGGGGQGRAGGKKAGRKRTGQAGLRLRRDAGTDACAGVRRTGRARAAGPSAKLAGAAAARTGACAVFDGCDLLIAADCTAYACGSFHADFIRGRVTLIGCPKLDRADYAEKLTAILTENDVRSVTLTRMEVPCCGGLEYAARQAVAASGKDIPMRVVTFTAEGKILPQDA